MGEWNEDEHGLAEDLVPLVLRHEFDRPAVVKAVCKLYQNYSDIVIQGKKNALEVLGLHALLLGLVFVVEHCLDLCKTFYKSSNLVTEQASDVIDSIVCIFDHIVEKGSDYRLVSETDIAHDYLRDCDRMKYIWLARTPSDALVGFICKLESLLYDFKFIRVCTTFPCRFKKIGIVSGNDFVVLCCKF